MMVGQVFVFLVLTGACQFGNGEGGFTTWFTTTITISFSIESEPREARRSSEECVGSHAPNRPNYESPRFAMVRKFSFLFCLVSVILASHFQARMDLPEEKKEPHLESGLG